MSDDAAPDTTVDAAPTRRRAFSVWRLLLGLVLLGGSLAFLLRSAELGALWAALRGADLRLIGLAVVVDLGLNTIAFVQRLRILLHAFPVGADHRRERFWDVVGVSMTGYAASALLPGQPGLALRTVVLHRRFGYRYADLISAQLVEKVIEVLSLSMLGWGALFARPVASVAAPLWAVVLGAPAAAAVLWFASQRLADPAGAPDALRASGLLGRVGRALRTAGQTVAPLRAGRRLGQSLLFSVASHLCGVLALGLCLRAVGLALPVPAWFLLYLVVNLALVVPLTPGQVGIVEAGVVAALTLWHVPHEAALAFAFLHHGVVMVPTVLLGLCVLPWSLRR